MRPLWSDSFQEVMSLTTEMRSRNCAQMVVRKYAEHQKNKRTHHRLQEVQRRPPSHLHNSDCVERVHSFNSSDNLSWSISTTAVVKKAQQRLHFLGVLRKNNLTEKLLVAFYRSTKASRGSLTQHKKSMAALSPPNPEPKTL